MSNTSAKRDVYLCDIDGTLADHRGIRDVYDDSKVHLDKTLPTVDVIQSIFAAGKDIIFVSGRGDNCRRGTEKWLLDKVGFCNDLFMRKSGDFRSDEIIKKEIYDNHIKDNYNVLGVFDDRLKVIRMWEKEGLFVFNCNQGNIEF